MYIKNIDYHSVIKLNNNEYINANLVESSIDNIPIFIAT